VLKFLGRGKLIIIALTHNKICFLHQLALLLFCSLSIKSSANRRNLSKSLSTRSNLSAPQNKIPLSRRNENQLRQVACSFSSNSIGTGDKFIALGLFLQSGINGGAREREAKYLNTSSNVKKTRDFHSNKMLEDYCYTIKE